jgi:hypothetical protein
MYKGASQRLQHRHRVSMPLPTGGYIGTTTAVDDDFIPSADNMSLEEVEAERRQLLTELTKAQNQLLASKSAGDNAAINGLGLRIQGYVTRLALLKQRRHALRQEDSNQAFSDAVKQLLDEATLERIYERQQELLISRKALKGRAG